jgi:hypothetical protein
MTRPQWIAACVGLAGVILTLLTPRNSIGTWYYEIPHHMIVCAIDMTLRLVIVVVGFTALILLLYPQRWTWGQRLSIGIGAVVVILTALFPPNRYWGFKYLFSQYWWAPTDVCISWVLICWTIEGIGIASGLWGFSRHRQRLEQRVLWQGWGWALLVWVLLGDTNSLIFLFPLYSGTEYHFNIELLVISWALIAVITWYRLAVTRRQHVVPTISRDH